jgi:protein-L-isoaspartate O-methyltransferase
MTAGRRTATAAMAATARELRRELAAALVAAGTIRSDWVREAFETVPREVFAPRFFRWADGQQVLVSGAESARRDEWLRGVYSDNVLVVQLTAAPGVSDPDGIPTSSSSMPTVMAGMLESLDLQPGQRVLEIGTGTGYNAALMSHRTGDDNVTSIELDPQLADAARTALAEVGLYPGVHVGDGAAGVPEAAPFDRIIATAATDHIPPEWIDQLAPGGAIVADLRGSLAGGIVVLTRSDDGGEVVGSFAELPGATP